MTNINSRRTGLVSKVVKVDLDGDGAAGFIGWGASDAQPIRRIRRELPGTQTTIDSMLVRQAKEDGYEWATNKNTGLAKEGESA